jgi:hypothetical protein
MISSESLIEWNLDALSYMAFPHLGLERSKFSTASMAKSKGV